jgi:HSP20 family protein
MAAQQVALQEKKELAPTQERTEAGKFFSPYADIHETEDAVVVTMEMPGVDKAAVDIRIDKGVLTVIGNIDSTRYEALRPIYSEYNVGNFCRTFTVSTKIDSARISAAMADGVLTVNLPKAAEAVAKRISVN